MAASIAGKLKIKEGHTLLTINAPRDFEATLSPLPDGVNIVTSGKDIQQIHWFVQNQAQMEKDLNKVLRLMKGEVVCWAYYPKGSSGIQTDLTRDKGWEKLLTIDFQWLSLISFNDTWSTFAFRLKTEADAKKEAKPKEERLIFQYADPVTKTVIVPEDLAKALNKNKQAGKLFNALAYSHRREYVEWIITAKKEETRANRIEGTIDRLMKGWKNPANNK
ncbi:YdeI/OmpD-associated family protein [Paraflavitalea sp. CAU 1676]|uniref:YdeI/OmpD-associated family protein n=1 Tax=Paraflavitalea sp. CAU 1676 TaxID=3032598 RepID=UPI0023DA344A|nr:YdeI/OmpD-associated family protein [Paraflavitalea sp. CAU 1676]MDF2187788.1 YdeI/OmpD-associated family protein [Paraflavitalea sp. CAU 1676]